METMVWNVLWMAAMAAAAMLAGFCMGRLTMRNEVETAGEGAVQAYGVGWKGREKLQKNESASNNGISSIQSISYDEETEGQWATNEVLEGGDETEWRSGTDYDANNTFDAGIGLRRSQRPNRRSTGGETWILKAASAARAVVAESRKVSAGAYGHGVGQSRVDRSGRTSRGRHRGLNTMRLMRRDRDSHESEGESYSLGSPVSGYVVSFREGDRPAAVIQPMEDKLYAPAAGKIIRLFPMGNDFLFVTEFGTELRIRAGDADDDLLGRHFRPRVVQNEIVAKGKLLLEFDRQSLAAEGASTMITVSVEHRAYSSNVRLTADEEVKAGEELLRIVERVESGNVRRE